MCRFMPYFTIKCLASRLQSTAFKSQNFRLLIQLERDSVFFSHSVPDPENPSCGEQKVTMALLDGKSLRFVDILVQNIQTVTGFT